MKACNKCKSEKPLVAFSKDRTRKDGVHGCCKACVSARQKVWVKKNPEKVRARGRLWAAKHSDRLREAHRAWAKANPIKADAWKKRNKDKVRAKNWRHKGIPAPTRPCPPACECCGGPPGKFHLSADHCHTKGVFRGWLCGRCNTGLGGLGDNFSGLLRAIEYLIRSGTV